MEPTQPETGVISKPSNQVEIHEPPTISNPWGLMDSFYSSPRYQHNFTEFFKDKTLDASVTEKQKEKVFLENHVSRKTLIDFATTDVDFKYESALFPKSCSEALGEYAKVIIDRKRELQEKNSPEKIIALDEYRRKYHSKAAETLVQEGIAPTINIGEALARIVIIEKGLGSPEAAKVSTKDRVERKLI